MEQHFARVSGEDAGRILTGWLPLILAEERKDFTAGIESTLRTAVAPKNACHEWSAQTALAVRRLALS
jgi:hypothetical protein